MITILISLLVGIACTAIVFQFLNFGVRETLILDKKVSSLKWYELGVIWATAIASGVVVGIVTNISVIHLLTIRS